jgi:predicted SAM-dependent methyltransferase
VNSFRIAYGRAVSAALTARVRAWNAAARTRYRVDQRVRQERRRRSRLHALQFERGLLLDLGASSLHLPGWVSLDIEPDELGIRMDAAKRWPFADHSARAVRGEHVIEHLTFDEAEVCIREMFRVLEPGGVCRICTPDLEGIARAYVTRDEDALEIHRLHGYVAPTWSHLPNNYMRMWGHQYMFDFDALSYLLERAGFEGVERASFNTSRHAVLNGTDSHDPEGLERLVVCVDAVKPVSAR